MAQAILSRVIKTAVHCQLPYSCLHLCESESDPCHSGNRSQTYSSYKWQFLTADITVDERKYNSVIQCLDDDSLTEVSDIIFNPPATDR